MRGVDLRDEAVRAAGERFGLLKDTVADVGEGGILRGQRTVEVGQGGADGRFALNGGPGVAVAGDFRLQRAVGAGQLGGALADAVFEFGMREAQGVFDGLALVHLVAQLFVGQAELLVGVLQTFVAADLIFEREGDVSEERGERFAELAHGDVEVVDAQDADELSAGLQRLKPTVGARELGREHARGGEVAFDLDGLARGDDGADSGGDGGVERLAAEAGVGMEPRIVDEIVEVGVFAADGVDNAAQQGVDGLV